MPKNPTPWITNPNAQANQRVYDAASVYDSGTLTYDGVVAGQSPNTNKVPTNWVTI